LTAHATSPSPVSRLNTSHANAIDKLCIPPSNEKSKAIYGKWKKAVTLLAKDLTDEDDKLFLLNIVMAPDTFNLIENCLTFKDAIDILDTNYLKEMNIIVCRNKFFKINQELNENYDDYRRRMEDNYKNCKYPLMDIDQMKDVMMRDYWILSIKNNDHRQKLLQRPLDSFIETFKYCVSLEEADKCSSNLKTHSTFLNNITDVHDDEKPEVSKELMAMKFEGVPATKNGKRCSRCNRFKHPPTGICPAVNKRCAVCRQYGHFRIVCAHEERWNNFKTMNPDKNDFEISRMVIDWIRNNKNCESNKLPVVNSLSYNNFSDKNNIIIGNFSYKCLIDSGASYNFLSTEIHIDFAKLFPCTTIPEISVKLADNNSVVIDKRVVLDFYFMNRIYKNVEFFLISNLSYPVILGNDFLYKHEKVIFNGQGPLPKLEINSVKAMKSIGYANPFKYVSENIKPIAVPSRKYCPFDKYFIKDQIDSMLANDIIEPSFSCWRAQCVVVNRKVKPRLVIDYSMTINRFTLLDSYPLPRIDELIQEIAGNNVFSKLDLKSAYYQVELEPSIRHLTAFEGNGRLYHYKRLPMGLANSGACFMRIINKIIDDHKLKGVLVYLDDITIVGKNKIEHDLNLSKFLEIVKTYNMTINEKKSNFELKSIKILGHLIENNCISPDPDRWQGLADYLEPQTNKEFKRLKGLLAYYSKWVQDYSGKLAHFSKADLPLNTHQLEIIKGMFDEIKTATLKPIDYSVPFMLETDASNHSISSILSQNGKPVSFFSRMLSKSELNHSSYEKEALSIVESVRRYSHLLRLLPFVILTDQQSVSFIFHSKHKNIIKNEKTARWRLELMDYKYDIKYRKGCENTARKNNLSNKHDRGEICNVNSIDKKKLFELHCNYGHPGQTRMLDLIKTMKLPFNLDDIREMIKNCNVCAKLKPNFSNNNEGNLIRSTRPLQKLSCDFKGKLPATANGNLFLFVVVDEFSRYCWAFPTKDQSSNTVIDCLEQIFSAFGLPESIQSDNAKSFINASLKEYLLRLNISTVHSSPYNPASNGQVERMNKTIYNTVKLMIECKGLRNNQWDLVINEALNAQRSLLCTSTGSSPHDRLFGFKRKLLPCFDNKKLDLSSDKFVYVRNFLRKSKNDPISVKAKLLNFNPSYSVIQYLDGRISNVNNKDIGVCPSLDDLIDSDDSKIVDNVPKLEVGDISNDFEINDSSVLEPRADVCKDENIGVDDIAKKSMSDLTDTVIGEDHSTEPNNYSVNDLDLPIALRKSARNRTIPKRYLD